MKPSPIVQYLASVNPRPRARQSGPANRSSVVVAIVIVALALGWLSAWLASRHPP